MEDRNELERMIADKIQHLKTEVNRRGSSKEYRDAVIDSVFTYLLDQVEIHNALNK